MIIITPARYRFLKTGRPTLIPVPNPGRYHKGRDYAVGFNHRHETCRVDILDTTDHAIRVRLAQDRPRLLALYSQYGYVTEPHRAMSHEPEAIDSHTLERYAQQAQERRQAPAELAQQRGRSIGIQVKDAARRGDFAAFNQLAVELQAIARTAGTAVAA